MQTFVTNNVFLDEKVKRKNKQNIKHKNPLPEAGIEPGTS